MLKIRLQRIGKRGQAYFKVVVTEHTRKPKGKYLELLGSYDPHKNEMNVDAEKVKHWLSQGAKMSATVNNLLVGRGVIEGEKVGVWKPKTHTTETQKGQEDRNLDQGITTEGSTEWPSADTEIRKNQETEAQKKIEATETKPVEAKEELKAEESSAEITKEEAKTEEPAPEVPEEEIKEEKKEETAPASTEVPAEVPAIN